MDTQILLTDGSEVFEVRHVDRLKVNEILDDLNAQAKVATDGNLFWVVDKRGYMGSELVDGYLKFPEDGS